MDILVEITIRAFAGAMDEPIIKELNFCVPSITSGDETAVPCPDMRTPIQSAIEVAAIQAFGAERLRIGDIREPFGE